ERSANQDARAPDPQHLNAKGSFFRVKVLWIWSARILVRGTFATRPRGTPDCERWRRRVEYCFLLNSTNYNTMLHHIRIRAGLAAALLGAAALAWAAPA